MSNRGASGDSGLRTSSLSNFPELVTLRADVTFRCRRNHFNHYISCVRVCMCRLVCGMRACVCPNFSFHCIRHVRVFFVCDYARIRA